MRIAVIGMGNVGSALGNWWAGAGHDVTFCVRDLGNARKRADAGKMKAKIGPVSDGTADDCSGRRCAPGSGSGRC